SFLQNFLDDAVGECLDKISLLLGHNYPGGPIIEKLAQTGKSTYQLPLTKLDETYDFSFSGLKTAVRLLIEKEDKRLNANDLACSLQYTLAKILTFKIEKVLQTKKVNTVVLGGGVVANKYLTNYLKEFLQKKNKNIRVFIPPKKYCTDNAAMMGILAYYKISNDEAGRGALAGPIVVAAVILPTYFYSPLIRDSKILKPVQRNRAYGIIRKAALTYSVAIKNPREVESKNPLQATKEAMVEATLKLKVKPDLCLVDGKEEIIIPNIPTQSIIGGDQSNKGYPNPTHLKAIFKYGICSLHRKTYEPIKSLVNGKTSREALCQKYNCKI
ncbi:15471_t:CDS:2, partial [Racocetra persica]